MSENNNDPSFTEKFKQSFEDDDARLSDLLKGPVGYILAGVVFVGLIVSLVLSFIPNGGQ